jgi:hypothetical protein
MDFREKYFVSAYGSIEEVGWSLGKDTVVIAVSVVSSSEGMEIKDGTPGRAGSQEARCTLGVCLETEESTGIKGG